MSEYDLRVKEIDQVFAAELTDNCIDAAIRASANFDERFPGWQLYCKVVRGDSLYDRHLDAWAIGLARGLTRAKKADTGRDVLRRSARGPWVAVAGLDALHRCVMGRFMDSGERVSAKIGARYKTYLRIRDALAGGMLTGFENYRAELHYQYVTVLREARIAA